MYLIFFSLSSTSDSHLNSLFLISSQLSLSLISTLLAALSFSHLNSAPQSQSASLIQQSNQPLRSSQFAVELVRGIVRTWKWSAYSTNHDPAIQGLDGSDPASTSRSSVTFLSFGSMAFGFWSDLWLSGFDKFFIICLISGF